MSLNWYESCDALDNTMWEAPGPYTDELGSPEFLFRLCPALIADAVVWQDHSDQELSTPLRRGRTWDTLEEAKAELEKEASEMVVAACPERIKAGVKTSARESSLTRETGEGLGLVKVDLDSLVPKGFQACVSQIEGGGGCNRGGDIFPSCMSEEQREKTLRSLVDKYIEATRGPGSGRRSKYVEFLAETYDAIEEEAVQVWDFKPCEFRAAVSAAEARSNGFDYAKYLENRERDVMSNEDLLSGECRGVDESGFRSEYLCEPASQIPARLWELAEEYHGRTEEFDRGVCTGPVERGAVMPANGREMGLIRRNAGALRSALREVAQEEGFSVQELDSAIGAVGVEFSYDAWLKKQQMGMS